jgi:hypothetical protein
MQNMAVIVECPYCGQINPIDRLDCRTCGGPLMKKSVPTVQKAVVVPAPEPDVDQITYEVVQSLAYQGIAADRDYVRTLVRERLTAYGQLA